MVRLQSILSYVPKKSRGRVLVDALRGTLLDRYAQGKGWDQPSKPSESHHWPTPTPPVRESVLNSARAREAKQQPLFMVAALNAIE